MTPDRWNQVKELMDAALEVAPRHRAAFVAERSAGDEELRQEVLSLLESHEDAGDFLEDPAVDIKPKPQADLVGTRVGAYELVRELGRGGMGAVYLGVRVDNEFRKRVAIKLIRRDMESGFAVNRFRNERQILARLEHPNIARLIDGGTTEGGYPYFIMEYVEGEPLLFYSESRALAAAKRIEIFQSVCSAVQYAHRRMIVHRDLKPNNILVKADGTPKLLDFGVAKILDPQRGDTADDATLAGFRMITPAYASPEQVRGEPATVGSDIYSLGVVLWELMTGRKSRQESGARALEMPDAGATDTASRLLRNIRNVALKATREEPRERYESVDALAADLRKVLEGGDVAAEGTGQPEAAETPQHGSIAILPFQFLGTETGEAYLGLGIADAVITRLSNIGRIAVRPTGAVMKFAAGCDAMEAGRQLNVHYVLEGRVQKLHGRVRVTVQLVEVNTGKTMWAAGFNEELDDLLKVEDSISAQVAQALVPQMTGEEQEELARSGTSSAKAHQAYLRGRWYWNQHSEESLPHALVLFTEAVAEDPQYGRAHAGIADYHIALGMRGLVPPVEAFAAAMQSARTAIELDGKLAEAHASLGLAVWLLEGDYEAAAHHLQLAIALNPEYAVAHDWFGLMNLARGRTVIATASIERARQLDPHSAVYLADLAMCHYAARDYRQVSACLAKPGNGPAEPPPLTNGAVLPLSLVAAGDPQAGVEAAARFGELTGRSMWSIAVMAWSEAAAGNQERAQTLREELGERSRDYYVPGVALALTNLACGLKAEAIRALERGCRDREWWTTYLAILPVWDELHGQARFERLTKAARKLTRVPAERPFPRLAAPERLKRSRALVGAAVGAAALLAGVYLLKQMTFAPAGPPLQNARLSRLTTNGIAERAVISPDGRLVAYTLRNEGKASVWVRNMESGRSYEIAGPFSGLVSSLEFTHEGADVAFGALPVNDAGGGNVHIVPAEGGALRTALTGIPLPVGTSPDETRFAYYRVDPESGADQLVVQEGGRERVLRSQHPPEFFSRSVPPAWSPDGRQVVCAVTGRWRSRYGVRLAVIGMDGSAVSLSAPEWQAVWSIAWLRGSQALMVAGEDRDVAFQQIWYVPLAGAPARVTNDLNHYSSVGVTADGSSMVAVQSQVLANLYVQSPGEAEHPRQITAGAGRYFDVTWTPGGHLLYASDSTGAAEIWTMDGNGNGQRQLTNGLGRSYAPTVSPDGRTIVFHSNRGGVWNLWKMGADGSNPQQLTHDASDSNYPQFTPDGDSVVYEHLGQDAIHSIWKVSLASGAARQLTLGLTRYPAVSSDGRLAFWSSESRTVPSWKIGVSDGEGTAVRVLFGFRSDRMPQVHMRWVPGEDAISYIEDRDGISNIWVQPLGGGPARRATRFTSGHIYSFDWSTDGRLVCSRGMTTRDVVMMRR